MDTEKKQMSLEEAISHCEKQSQKTKGLCSLEHKQLQGWLEELKEMKDLGFPSMIPGALLICQERQEQIEYGFNAKADNNPRNKDGELSQAAIFCLTQDMNNYPKGWGEYWGKHALDKKNRMSEKRFKIEMLKIAGALIAAEIDRIQLQGDK